MRMALRPGLAEQHGASDWKKRQILSKFLLLFCNGITFPRLDSNGEICYAKGRN